NASNRICAYYFGESCTSCNFESRPNGGLGYTIYNCSIDYCVFPSLGISIVYNFNDLPESVVYWPIIEYEDPENPVVEVFTGNCYVQIYDQCEDPDNHIFSTVVNCPNHVQTADWEGSWWNIYKPKMVNGVLFCENWVPPIQGEYDEKINNIILEDFYTSINNKNHSNHDQSLLGAKDIIDNTA